MITEEQFTAAMERAVEKRGAEWRYPDHHQAPPGFYLGNCPTYQDNEGNPTCLIGAAMHQLGMTLPHSGMGGSLGTALPEREIGFGYVMNQMQLGMTGDQRTATLVAEAYSSLG